MSPTSWRDEAVLRARSEADTLLQLAAAEEQVEHLALKLVEAEERRADDRAVLDNYIARIQDELMAARHEIATLKGEPPETEDEATTATPPAPQVPESTPPPSSGPFLPMCRQCRTRFESDNPQAKACPACKEQAKAKPSRPGLTAAAPVATAPAPRKPPGRIGRPPKAQVPADATPSTLPTRRHDDLDDREPVFNVRKTIACRECAHAKPNKAADSGFECLAHKARDCGPLTFARHLQPLKKEA